MGAIRPTYCPTAPLTIGRPIEHANAIFEYLEIFHNRRRRHSALGMLTPIEYELRQLTVPSIA
jgi:transposase InsO family protein